MMGEKIKVGEILSWTKSKLILGDISQYIKSVSTDSRTIKPGEFFIPLRGEHYDGHNFISSALGKGASGFVYESRHINRLSLWKESGKSRDLKNIVIFQTEDSLKFLEDIAYHYVRKYGPTVIGITGSVGKTTTKCFLVSVLSRVYNIEFTPRNFNTEIGVSKSILEIDKNTDYFIAELGMRGKGQIRLLSDICDVDIGIVTAVGQSHLGFFSGLHEIAKAKSEIGEILEKKDGILFLNKDDDWSSFIRRRVGCRTISFGKDNNIEYNFIEKDVDRLGRFIFDFCSRDRKITEIHLSTPGYHNMYNACCAAAVCMYLDVKPVVIKEGIEQAAMEENRMEVLERKDKIIINDCYNASPLSVRKAIETLELVSIKNGRRSVAILGDMLELGKESARLHREIGKYLAEKKIDVLVAFGKFSDYICKGYEELKYTDPENKGLCFYFKNKEDLSKKINNILKAGDLILIKGSRANKMESIIDLI